MLHFQKESFKNLDDLTQRCYRNAVVCIDDRKLRMGVSGGSITQIYPKLSEMLSTASELDSALVWNLDERYVPREDDLSNQKTIREKFMAHERFKFQMFNTRLPRDKSVAEYEDRIIGNLKKTSRFSWLDIAFMGIGPDGHIASIFPDVDPATIDENLVFASETDNFDVKERLGVSYYALEMAIELNFVLIGKHKRELFEKVGHDKHFEFGKPDFMPVNYLLHKLQGYPRTTFVNVLFGDF